jgi:flavin-dependent dehydrogenase
MDEVSSVTFDVIIVGAGPAGSAAAILLARAGWAVALVERQPFPRRKVCGECLAASNLPLLELLGIAGAFEQAAGAELRQVRLMRAGREVSAELPACAHPGFPWGRALGRETLDNLLLEQARAAGAEVFQPWSVQAIGGVSGRWRCELRAPGSARLMRLGAELLIDAHGSWDELPAGPRQGRPARDESDLFAFKASFKGASHRAGAITVLALDGGYGGMVLSDAETMTLACCIRRDQLSKLRRAAPGLCAGDAVQAWLGRECVGVARALHHASRDGQWLASGPLAPGVRLGTNDGIFRIGNAAGEAHPIIGEGLSMALQSAALLCSHLLGDRRAVQVPAADAQADIQRRYAAAWRREFAPRMRLAAAFAHAAMRPSSAFLLMALAASWPALLTHGARWGAKVRLNAGSLRLDRPPPLAQPRTAKTATPIPSHVP